MVGNGEDSRLIHARRLVADGGFVQAEALLLSVLGDLPRCSDAYAQLAGIAIGRGESARAAELLEKAVENAPDDPWLMRQLGLVYLESARPEATKALMERCVALLPEFYPGWMLLGRVRDAAGDLAGANKALYMAIQSAQRQGHWKDEASTPPQLRPFVRTSIERVRAWRRAQFLESFADLRQRHGRDELRRVERALLGYLGEWDASPADPRQRPKFMYFPDIPSSPYLDPGLQPWSPRLLDAYHDVRAEAEALLAERIPLPGFLEFKEGDDIGKYLGGTADKPAWNAFFFYRHGKRYDENHARCPKTSSLLESIELCRIRGQAPEVCFSVLEPGSHIMPHYGVSNIRVVVHMPLVVDGDCALNIIDAGSHHWKEGELMMFDDTYQHEAWNRSDKTRVILLMDAWNPHLTGVEKLAIKQLVESISSFEGREIFD